MRHNLSYTKLLVQHIVNHNVITHLRYESGPTQQKPPLTFKIDKDTYGLQMKWDFPYKNFTGNA